MTMRSAVVAMLWENWRLSRVEAAWRLVIGLVGGAGALVLLGSGAAAAFWLLMAMHAFFYMSIARLNGGRFIDGYKPGFPLYLLYTRPVSTTAFVGVAIAYDVLSCVALYLVSAALLGFAFGQPLPLFPAAVCVASFHLVYIAVQWSTRNRIVQWTGSILFSWPYFWLIKSRLSMPLHLEFTPTDYAVMALVGAVSIAVTIAGVARQRRGDAIERVPQLAMGGAFPQWLTVPFRFPRGNPSALRAQVWFELRSGGLAILAIGLALSILAVLLFASSIPLAVARPGAISAAMFFVPFGLLILSGNAFGIRRKQGKAFASTFEATQPCSTGRMAALKILVRTSCVLLALAAIGLSTWLSSSLLSAWGPWLADGKHDATLGLLKVRADFARNFGGQAAHLFAAQAMAAAIAVAGMVALRAAFTALMARYRRGLLMAGGALQACGLALVLFAWATQRGFGSWPLLEVLLEAAKWSSMAAVAVLTIYLSWRVLAERLADLRSLAAAVLVTAAFAAAWLAVLRAAGVSLAGTSATDTLWALFPVVLPLTLSVLAPWSLGRIRHT